jgi:hypothetical protein
VAGKRQRMGRRLLVEMRVTALDAEITRSAALLENEITRLVNRVGKDEVIRLLQEGRIDELVSQIGKVVSRDVTQGINEMAADSFYSEVVANGEYFRWEWEPAAKHCPDCTDRNGKVGTGEEMESVGVPGTGNTECSLGCQCRVVLITKDEYGAGEKITG